LNLILEGQAMISLNFVEVLTLGLLLVFINNSVSSSWSFELRIYIGAAAADLLN